jgi:hypothetical protein
MERRRAPVSRGIDPHDLVIAGQLGGDRAPAIAVLGEPVDEHEPRAAAIDLGVQHAERAVIRHPAELSTKMDS